MQILVKKDGDEVTAVATDGYIMGKVVQTVPSVDDFPRIDGVDNKEITEAYIDRDVALKAIKSIPKKTALPVLTFALVQEEFVTVTDLDTYTTFRKTPPEGDYPKHDELIPEPAEKQVTLNPKYLIKALKMFDKHEGMTIEFGKDKLSPVVLRSNSGGVKKTVLVMPLKG
jgi:DNA polymerase III sliding clamp (beta) subunit (PCNA family)